MYEFLEDYQLEEDVEERKNILNQFMSRIWTSNNPRHKFDSYIKFKVYKDDYLSSIFKKYEKVEYKKYKSSVKTRDNWILLRQKINNIYTNMCDKEICINKEYIDSLSEPKRLYYRYIKNENLDINEDLESYLSNSISNSKIIFEKYSKRKINLKWEDYVILINNWMENIFNNYIPVEEYELKHNTNLDISVDYWTEDNYIVRYIGKSLNGYMRNYQKSYYELRRNREYKLCSCGGMIEKIQHGKSRKGFHYKCNKCRKSYVPKQTKIIICVDCGKEIEINSKNNKTCRCLECQKEKDKKRKNEWKSKK